MSKKLVTSYTFVAASKTITAADFTSLEKIQLITNVTDNIIIYNFADATKGGTLAATVLTLAYDTTSMADADKLQIFVDDGTGGPNQYLVDAVAGGTDTGTAALAVRDDVLTTLTPADGDYTRLRTDQYGALWVSMATKLNSTDDSVSAIVSNVTPGTSATDLGKAEDAVHASGDTGVMALGVRQDTQVSLSGTSGDYNPFQVDAFGALWVAGSQIEDGAHTSGHRGIFALGVRNEAQTTLTSADGDYSPIATDAAGNIGVSSTTATQADGLSNASIRMPGTAAGSVINQRVFNTVFNGTTWDRQRGDTNGTYTVGNVAAAATDAGNPVKVGGVYNSTSPTYTTGQRGDVQLGSRGSVNVQLMTPDSTVAITASNDNSDAVAPVTSVNGLRVMSRNTVFNGSTWDRMRGDTSGLYVQERATATGGYTPGKLISAATTNATSVKASAGTLGFIQASNINASPRYLKIYNKASAPTVGTDVPVAVYLIPGNTAGAGTNIPFPPQGMALGTGIAFAITTGVADSDTGAVAASEIVINYGTA